VAVKRSKRSSALNVVAQARTPLPFRWDPAHSNLWAEAANSLAASRYRASRLTLRSIIHGYFRSPEFLIPPASVKKAVAIRAFVANLPSSIAAIFTPAAARGTFDSAEYFLSPFPGLVAVLKKIPGQRRVNLLQSVIVSNLVVMARAQQRIVKTH